MVLVGAADPDPGRQRRGKLPPRVRRNVARPGAIGDLVRRQVRQQDAQGRHEEQRHADAHEQLHQGDMGEVHLVGEAGAHVATGADGQEGHAGQQAQVERCAYLPTNGDMSTGSKPIGATARPAQVAV
jgi:hypothetical protein